MARMSVDDMLGRDPRLMRLAKACGWSRRETAGCLVLDVWPLCYDREHHELADIDIDIASGVDGFAQLMVDAGLAVRVRRDRVRVAGAKKRIAYLRAKKAAGYAGGLKSAEARRKEVKQNASTGQAESKQTSSKPQAAGNPSVPSSVPAPVLVPASASPPDPAPDQYNVAPTADAAALGDVKTKTLQAVKDKADRIPERAWRAADYLRTLVLEEDPQALVCKQPWTESVRNGWRLGWADQIRLMVERDHRTYEQIAEVMHYVFREQKTGPKFVVQSADSLREKFDRIQAVRRNNAPRNAAVGRVEPKQPSEYPDGEVPI